mgnify:CR=1 FL=1
MTSNDFMLIRNIAHNIGSREHIKLKDPAHLSDENGKSLIFNYFTDSETMDTADNAIEGVYFTTDNRAAGCAIFKALTNKEADTCIQAIDDDDRKASFVGFTIAIEMEKPANPDERSTQLRCATIAFTMEDEDGMHDILHEDIDNCIDILVEATETILHP